MKNRCTLFTVAGSFLVIALPLLTGCQDGQAVTKEHAAGAQKDSDYVASSRSDELLNKYESVTSEDAMEYCNLGFAFIDLNRYQDAISPLRKAISLSPNLAEAHCNLGIAYIGLDRLQEAADSLEQAIRLKPEYAEAQAKLGIVYIMQGHYEEAIEPLNQAIRLNPDYAGAYFGLGAAYAKLGNKESALEQYEILKTLDAKMAARFLREFQKQEQLMAQNNI